MNVEASHLPRARRTEKAGAAARVGVRAIVRGVLIVSGAASLIAAIWLVVAFARL